MRVKKPAFSLIELLLAVAVVAILVTVVVQDLNQSRTRAYDSSIKSSVNGYRQALELHQAQYKTYFVYDRVGGSCVTGARSGAYRLMGTGAACVGLFGGSQGRMTRKDITGKYSTQSIADILVKEGVLSEVQTYPDMKNKPFSDNTIAAGRTTNDFVLTLCDEQENQAVSMDSALNFGIFVDLKQNPAANSVEAVSTNQQCGGSGTTGGWSVFSEN